MKKETTNEYQAATADFLKALEHFSEAQFNKVPFAGSWTAAQVADHMLLSQIGLPDVFNGKTKPADRKPDELFAMIENVFLDFSTKLKSPDIILPAIAPQDKSDLLERYRKASDSVISAFEATEPTDICLDFELPVSGALTRLEWLHFVACHTRRHTHQLENILQQIN